MLRRPQSIEIQPLRPYEDRLLAALSFFRFQRQHSVQANHCLSLYLRQSKQRIFDEISFYASPLGLSPEALLELIYQDPHGAEQKIREQFDLPPDLALGVADPLDDINRLDC